ncbi:MAG: hypothetical protein HDQ88_07925 [Clostridia bacterium]|nr:hypothetical protein [Clostridia bacterium]
MSKYLKLFLSVCLIACMAVCLGLFAVACNPTDDGDDKDTDAYFTVTVKLPDDTVVSGAEVQICTLNGTIQTCLDAKVITGADGVAKFNLSSPVDVTDTTLFLVKVHNLPDGYIYADAQGVEYAEGYGDKFDVTVTGYSVTVKLTEEVLDETTHKMAIGESVVAYNGHTYLFTAPKAGSYKFSANADKWTIDGARQSDIQVLKTLTANQKVTLTITNDEDFAGSLYVNYGEGSNLDPVALTLGQENSVEITLVKTTNRMGAEKLNWNVDENNYCYKFTPAESGTYNLYATSTFDADELEIAIESSTGVPDFEYDWDEDCWAAELTAGVEYVITVSSNLTGMMAMQGYLDLGATEGQKITIGTKIEASANNGGEESNTPVYLMVGEPYEATSGDYYFFSLLGGTYRITITNIANASGFECLVNNTPVVADPETPNVLSTTFVALERNANTIKVNGACTITITEEDVIDEITVGTAHNYTVTLEGGYWAYEFKFTSGQAGSYKITVTYTVAGDDVGVDVHPGDYNMLEPDEFALESNGISYTFYLYEDTEYFGFVTPFQADYSSLEEGATINYTIIVEYIG